MWRSWHSWLGLGLSLLVMVTAISGAILATEPVYDRIGESRGAADLSVAKALRQIAGANPRAMGERLKKSGAGDWTLVYNERNRRRERVVDPLTGKFSKARKRPVVYLFMRDLHRSFLLGEGGRWLSALSGVAMAILSLTGCVLLVRRMGGVVMVLTAIRSRDAGGLHAWTGRLAVLPLLILSITAVYFSAISFDIVAAGSGRAPAYPESLQELDPVAPWDLPGLQGVKLADVSEIVFPIPGDWFDVWAIKTNSAWLFFDQFTGDLLSADPLPNASKLYEFAILLHTAKGVWPWAIVLFLASSAVPFFAVTGGMIWWRGRRRGRIKNNASVRTARAVVLVGSEGGATWGFAKALQEGLHRAGCPVRVAAMNELRGSYPNARWLIVLCATYGEGDPPKSASKFLQKLQKLQSQHGLSHAVLAFGDKAFTHYCAFGRRVAETMQTELGPPALPYEEIDKQSVQSFEQWCRKLSAAIELPLEVEYRPKRPRTKSLQLARKKVYADPGGAMTVILRFTAPRLPFHRPGDLVQIYPPGSHVPRLYSLGSSSKLDGFMEIAVRSVEGGLCSGWLCSLEEGDEIEVTVERNDRFQMPAKRSVIMVGAGTGIAPFTGMIRHNKAGREVDLYWGGRDPSHDALYGEEIDDWLRSGALTRFVPAWSRSGGAKEYVQDRIRKDKWRVGKLIRSGSTIMVCGGTAMAAAVREEIDQIARGHGTSFEQLKRSNRYLEDIY